MNILRRRSLQLCALAMIATTVAGGISLSAQAATTPTAATVIAAATKSLAKETGVHIAVSTEDDKVLSTVVADIGKSSGYETYKKGGETFTISVTPTYAYLSGSKTGLTTLMGLTAAEATKVGSKSIAIKKGSSQYTTFKTNLTSAAFSQLLPAVKGTTLLAKRDKATGGYQLTWTTAATQHVAEDDEPPRDLLRFGDGASQGIGVDLIGQEQHDVYEVEQVLHGEGPHVDDRVLQGLLGPSASRVTQ